MVDWGMISDWLYGMLLGRDMLVRKPRFWIPRRENSELHIGFCRDLAFIQASTS
jgi:hypothetical protein